jgi:hypothetical protein
MNPLNHATLKACQRLQAAGIVLETEKVWALNEWPVTIDNHVIHREELKIIDLPMIGYKWQVPAPSFAEVWRELPQTRGYEDTYILQLHLGKNGITYAGYFSCAGYDLIQFGNINPTDALIDLLIWVTGEGKEEGKHHTKVFNAINVTAGPIKGETP